VFGVTTAIVQWARYMWPVSRAKCLPDPQQQQHEYKNLYCRHWSVIDPKKDKKIHATHTSLTVGYKSGNRRSHGRVNFRAFRNDFEFSCMSLKNWKKF